MSFTPEILPALIKAVTETIEQNAEEVTALDQVLGDGDHVTNLQRGLVALNQQAEDISQLEWTPAIKKIGMTLLSTMGGASGSLFGTLFISMSKAMADKTGLNQQVLSDIFYQGVEAVKKRGKAEAGEKTMLDVLIPVAEKMKQGAGIDEVCNIAVAGMQSTRDMKATKGRASYLEDKSIGHIDAGARTSQLMICAIVAVLVKA
jgi:dihydroxyacetone kinase-like protein